MDTSLTDLVRSELSAPVDQRVYRIAAAIAATYPESARAVLFYGSCLRERQFEGLMLDFYLIVSDYRASYHKRWLASANRLIPPNVFPYAFEGLAAKYAVLSEADFYRECGPQARTVSVWARFAQPSRLVWSADSSAAEHIVVSVARSAPTLLSLARPMMKVQDDALDIWRRGFALTYDCELRAEPRNRSGSIVDSDPERYRRFAIESLPHEPSLDPPAARRRWASLRRKGKSLSIARLAKASLTFSSGIDYLAWKINRHAGTNIVISPWQRRWPIIAALILLPRLLARGAVR